MGVVTRDGVLVKARACGGGCSIWIRIGVRPGVRVTITVTVKVRVTVRVRVTMIVQVGLPSRVITTNIVEVLRIAMFIRLFKSQID